MAIPALMMALLFPGDRRGCRFPAAARARPARRRLRRRRHDGRRHSFCNTWPAGRSGWRRGCAFCPYAGWASASSLARRRRGRRVAVCPSVPDLVLLLCRDCLDRSRSAGERAPVRPWRVRAGRRCDRADADRDRASVRAQSSAPHGREPGRAGESSPGARWNDGDHPCSRHRQCSPVRASG